MSIDKLTVKNIGPIKEAELDLRKVTILIGEQASGKSILAKLIATFSEFSAIRKGTLSSDYNLNSYFNNNAEASFKKENYSVQWIGKQYEKEKIERQYFNKAFEDLLEKFYVADAHFNSAVHQNNEIQVEYWNKILETTLEELYIEVPQILYVPTERLIISQIADLGYPEINNYFKRFFNRYRRKASALKKTSIDFLKISYESIEGRDTISSDKDKYVLDLKDASSGIQSVIPIVVDVESINGKNKYLSIIEEPELNLYPTTQKKLVEYLIGKCTKRDNQLIITTHSPYILAALCNLIESKNIVKQQPEQYDAVAKLVPPQYWLDFDDVAAYFVGNGTVRSIRDEEYQNIDANPLDDVSNDLGGIYDQLLDLKYATTAK